MSSTFQDFIQSPQFTFFVGQAGTPVVVHSAAIAATSQKLNALFNGGMEEAATRSAQLKDVEVEDFIRFCEYAYRGDYTTPPWEDVLQEPEPTSSACELYWSGNSWVVLSSKKKKKNKKAHVGTAPDLSVGEEEAPVVNSTAEPAHEEPECVSVPPSRIPLRMQLKSRTYLADGGPRVQLLQQSEPKPNTAAHQNFTQVLLAHARLYCFAHFHLVEPLKALTLDKLHKTLTRSKVFTARIGDIIELARFAYSNVDLPDRRDDGTIDDLKRLVVEYVLCEIDTIGKCDEFVKYIEDGGEFVGDFWRLARDYVV